MHDRDNPPVPTPARWITLKGRRIRTARRERHWTQGDLAIACQRIAAELPEDDPAADRTRMSMFTISKAELGHQVEPVTARLIALALDEADPTVFYSETTAAA